MKWKGANDGGKQAVGSRHTSSPVREGVYGRGQTSLNRRGAVERVTGQAKYSGDMKLPNMLYGMILRCPHPRARIVKIDTSRTEAMPGVKAVAIKG